MQTILVVEDESSIAHMLTMVLEMEGYAVLHANDGAVGLAMLAQHRPDLILCDVMMPQLDGREFVAALETSADYDAIPVIMMSAGLDHVEELNGKVVAFIRKPFLIDVLLGVIRRALAERANEA
jgi:two-component system, OmpR family, alkaline phosphatase synthesis response regulator PhoP